MKYRRLFPHVFLSLAMAAVVVSVARSAEPTSATAIGLQEVRSGDVMNEVWVETLDSDCAVLPLTRFDNMLGALPIGFAQGEGSVCRVGGDLFDLQIRAFSQASTDMSRLSGRHFVNFFVESGASSLGPGDMAELELIFALSGATSVMGGVAGQDSAQIQLVGAVVQDSAQDPPADPLVWGRSLVKYAEISSGGPEPIAYAQLKKDGETTAIPFAGGAFDSGVQSYTFSVPVGEGLRFEISLDATSSDFFRSQSKVEFQDTALMSLNPGVANPGIKLVPGVIKVPEPSAAALILVGLLLGVGRLNRRRS